jgi:hypothetical protein
MKECDGYGLAIASSILMIVLICLPIGIWSLVVLLNEDVKKAFQTSV